ncbi:glutamate racemase [Qipengyuania sp. JC766]|uniref:glutamate racemase n=1 Tax=Qipengyuania sp. JC766 TaxID=3232139 RepID=UPI00345A63F1
MDRNSPILLFDSGVGGLTVLAELRELQPDAPVLFAADHAGMPYGTKTEPEVAARVAGLLGRMAERYQPSLICIACNTASTIALSMVREVLEVPIVGTVPAIKPAAGMTKTGTIGLLGTEATIRQPYVDQLEQDFASDHRLLRHAAPGLVQLAEAKLRGRDVSVDDVTAEVRALVMQPGGQDIDTIVLACTHFPLLLDELAEAFGDGIAFVDGSRGIARRIAALTEGMKLERAEPDRAVTTGDLESFKELTDSFVAFNIHRLERF